MTQNYLSNVIWIALGGAIGSVCRYLVATMTNNFIGFRFPLGTLAVNVIGSFLVGMISVVLLKYALQNSFLKNLLIIGFLGGFTTFSSFSMETLLLYKDVSWLTACYNVLLNVIFSLAAVICGVGFAKFFE